MVTSGHYRAYKPALWQRPNCAKIVTFRIDRELNELISEAAKRMGKSKSEFIRESVIEFLRYLDGVGVRVELQSYTKLSNKRDHDNPVVLV